MKKISLILNTILLGIILLSACDKPSGKFSAGIWRGALITETGVEIPFNFEVKDSAENHTIYIINGEERFKVDEITRVGDSIHIRMPLFDSEINGVILDEKITGVWTKHLADKDVEMTFYAKANANWRISENVVESRFKVNGRWKTTFISEDGKDTTQAIGEFVQNKSKVTGTFLTTTGDYRYLEGVIDANKLSLSTFDGANAYLFTATVNADSTLTDGKFYAGFSHVENFSAKLDSTATLPDAYSLTYLKDKNAKIDFTFKDLNGKAVSLSDSKFKGKVVVLQILGSWCPNCMDETAYLAGFYERYKSKGVEVLGLAYERTKDFEKSKANIENVERRFNTSYPFLITGFTNKEASQSLPMLNKVMAFPTLIVIDKNGDVNNIHTGFNGPGTGKYYLEFTHEFETLIDQLVKS
ncbi:TlpA disulfide reductase family protein [Pedobacter arcticus]|uniref:TlpA disulfide reductase family protein n=1 Tax=Pedobacter arcticus TaxID=752140 RepID=UPI0002F33309|nr:TlpA disulfide reductase family protein [Pedobacter arcticus]